MEKIGNELICGVEEAVELLDISKPTLRKYIESGLIPHRKIGGRYIFVLRDLQSLADIDPEAFRAARFLKKKAKNIVSLFCPDIPSSYKKTEG